MEVNTVDEGLMSRCADGANINIRNLETIIADNVGTAFGKEHRFAEIKSFDDYRERVPLSDYSCYTEMVERMRGGEKNVLTAYPVISYCLSSGSTGKAKHIPVTDKTLEKHADCYERYRLSVLKGKKGKRLLINTFRTDLSKPVEQELLFTEIYYRNLYEKGQLDPDDYIGGKTLMFVKETEDTMYAKIWEALLTEDVLSFESIFLYEHLVLLNHIEENWRSILTDISLHRIPSDVKLSEEIKRYLLSLDVSEERLDYVRRECEKGFDGIVRRLWKNIVFLSGIGNRHYLTESESLKRYAPDIPRHHFIYGSSECHIGYPVRLDAFDYVLMPELAFFEFIPDGDDRKPTVLPHEVKTGGEYEPVFTNFSGLYRYRIGDMVKITGFIGQSPVMEFLYRKGQAINIANEKYNVNQLDNAVFDLRKDGIEIEDYCFGACLENLPGKYLAVMQMNDTGAITEQRLSELTDASLRRSNSDYDDLRNIGGISAPTVILCDAARYLSFAENSGLAHTSGHNKAKHIFQGEVSENKWRQMINY